MPLPGPRCDAPVPRDRAETVAAAALPLRLAFPPGRRSRVGPGSARSKSSFWRAPALARTTKRPLARGGEGRTNSSTGHHSPAPGALAVTSRGNLPRRAPPAVPFRTASPSAAPPPDSLQPTAASRRPRPPRAPAGAGWPSEKHRFRSGRRPGSPRVRASAAPPGRQRPRREDRAMRRRVGPRAAASVPRGRAPPGTGNGQEKEPTRRPAPHVTSGRARRLGRRSPTCGARW